MRFKGRIALITAAGRGIGRATAEIIGREGGTVVGVEVDKESLDQVVGVIRAAGGTAHGLVADALDATQVAGVVKRVVDEHGRIDILVNAVGGSTIIAKPAAEVDELTLDDWQRMLHFNLTGTFLFCNVVAPVMKRQRGGKIVNISSIAGRGLSPSSSSAYATAKGGIIAFTRKLSFELGPFGVTVNAIAPSLTLSPRLRPRWDRMSQDERAREEARVPLRRVAGPGGLPEIALDSRAADSRIDIGERGRDHRGDVARAARRYPALRADEAADEAHETPARARERLAGRHERAEGHRSGRVAHRGKEIAGAVRAQLVHDRGPALDEISLAGAEGGDGVCRG